MSVSREAFYRYQELVEDGGLASFIDKSLRSLNIKNKVEKETEQAVPKYTVGYLAHG